jgi:hypothetical protein
MDILAKLHEKNDQFEQLKAGVIERQNKIEGIKNDANAQIGALNNEITQITDEMKRIQGEYRVFAEIGKEQGLVDETGKIIGEDVAGKEIVEPAAETDKAKA